MASRQPAPGGGAAAALTAAVAAALIVKAARISKVGSARQQADLRRLRARMLDLMDADAVAYRQVVISLRKRRTVEVQSALVRATGVPLEVCVKCYELMCIGDAVAAHVRKSLAVDLGVALLLAHSAYWAARGLVDVNLASLEDRKTVRETRRVLRAIHRSVLQLERSW